MSRAEGQPQPSAPENSYPVDARIPFQTLNVFEQPRKTFTQIEELALNIARHGLLNPLIVAKVSLEEAQDYLNTINIIWRTKHSTDELIPNAVNGDGSPNYLILIGGERRFRAFKLLDSIGCLDCQEKYGENPCITRHLQFGPEKKVRSTLLMHYNTWDSIEIQFSENTHDRVPPDEEAIALDLVLSVRKSQEPSLTITEFARRVGKSPSAIYSALRFVKLPEFVREEVREGKLSYALALEVERAREGLNLDDDALRLYVSKAKVHRRVDDFRKAISREIEQRNSKEQTMLGLWTQEQEAQARRLSVRRTVAKEMIQAVWGNMGYMDKIRRLVKDGDLKGKDSPYSVKSPLKVFRAAVEQIRLLIPQFQELLKEEEFEKMLKDLAQSEDLLSQLIPRMPDEAEVFPGQNEALRLITR